MKKVIISKSVYSALKIFIRKVNVSCMHFTFPVDGEDVYMSVESSEARFKLSSPGVKLMATKEVSLPLSFSKNKPKMDKNPHTIEEEEFIKLTRRIFNIKTETKGLTKANLKNKRKKKTVDTTVVPETVNTNKRGKKRGRPKGKPNK